MARERSRHNFPSLSDLKQLETPPIREEWRVEENQDKNAALLHSFLALLYQSEEKSLYHSHCFAEDVERLQMLSLPLYSSEYRKVSSSSPLTKLLAQRAGMQ